MTKNNAKILRIDIEKQKILERNTSSDVSSLDVSWMTSQQKKYYEALRGCNNKNIDIIELNKIAGYISADNFYKRAVLNGDKERFVRLIHDMGFISLCVGYQGGNVYRALCNPENWERDIDELLDELTAVKNRGYYWSNIMSPEKTSLRNELREIGYPYYWMSYSQLRFYSYFKKHNISGKINVVELKDKLGVSISVCQKELRADEKMRKLLKEKFDIDVAMKKSPLPDYTEIKFIDNPQKRKHYMETHDIWDVRVLTKNIDVHKEPSKYSIDFTSFKGEKVKGTLKKLTEALLLKITGESIKTRIIHSAPFFTTLYELYGDISLAELDRSMSLEILGSMPKNNNKDAYNKIQRVKTVLNETHYYRIEGGARMPADSLISKYDLPDKSQFKDSPNPIPRNMVATLDTYLLDTVIPKLKANEPLEFGTPSEWDFLIIQRWTGRRYSDVIRLIVNDKKRECLRYDSKSEPVLFMHHDFVKTKKDLSIPLFAKDSSGDNIVEQAILRQKNRVKDIPKIRENKHGDIEFLYRMWDEDRRKTEATKSEDDKKIIVLLKKNKYRAFLIKLSKHLGFETEDGRFYEVTAHQFRHTMASELINAGVDIYVVQKFLGHSSIAMTEKYIDLLKETMRKEILSKLGESASERMIQDYEIQNTDNAYSIEWIKGKLTVLELGDGCCEHSFGSVCPQGIKCKTCHKKKIFPRHMTTVERELENAQCLQEAYLIANATERASEQEVLIDFYSAALKVIKLGEIFLARDWSLGKYK